MALSVLAFAVTGLYFMAAVLVTAYRLANYGHADFLPLIVAFVLWAPAAYALKCTFLHDIDMRGRKVR